MHKMICIRNNYVIEDAMCTVNSKIKLLQALNAESWDLTSEELASKWSNYSHVSECHGLFMKLVIVN